MPVSTGTLHYVVPVLVNLLCRPSGERLVAVLKKSLEIMGAKTLDYGTCRVCHTILVL